MIEDFEAKPVQQQTPVSTTTVQPGVPAFGQAAATQLRIPAKLAHHHRRFKEWFRNLSKKQKTGLISAAFALLIVLGGGASYAFMPKEAPVTSGQKLNTHNKVIPDAPKTVPSTLTGLQVDKTVNQRPVIGVMIENSLAARPQSGLDQAGVVFEAEAEGGITRFLALYQDSQPDYIGPVRSARPYYVQWCQGFDCAYAHVGGSPEALQYIKDQSVHDLNQFAGASYFDRIGSRAAPHNVYTSIDRLTQFAGSRGYSSSNFTGFIRSLKDGKANAAAPVAHSINFDYLGTSYDAHFDYDAATNSYKRSEAGAPHNNVDASGTTTQIIPKVVIAMAVPKSRGALDASNAYYNEYQVVGSGEADIFQNGTAIHGTWTKASPTDQISFLDDKGTTINLNPGQTWISILDSISKASYN